MKKILASILTLCLVASTLVIPAATAAAAESPDGIFTLLAELNIMTGDPDGNLRLDDPVTRAEFTKVAVAASSYKNSVATNLAISPFPDVTYKHWAASYVRVGVVNGLVSGYPDATFRPDETVLFEEGVTILLRVLGYTDSDFGASWPYGQISLADNLDLTDDLDCAAGDVLNRQQVAQLVYNALGTKTKGQNTQLASVFDVNIYEDVTLISDSNDDPSISSDEIYTSQGSYEISDSFDRTQLGLKGDAAVKNGSKLVSFVPNADSADSQLYVLYSVLPHAVMVYKDGALTQLSIEDSITVYKGKTQSTFGNLKGSLELGDVLRIKSSAGGIDYITCQTGDIQGPATVSASGWSIGWDTDSDTKVMRNGQSATLSALEPYDIAYFMPAMNLVLAYSDKVTGVYESASPNKDMPQSVTISGKSYSIESGSAFTALASGGEFAYGDTVTLLLGKDGEIAGVISPNANPTESLVGYILETGRKDYQTGVTGSYNGYYVKAVFPDGTTGEYATDTDKSDYKNKVAVISFRDGYARLSALDSVGTGKINGTYDHATGRLDDEKLASNADILDIGTVDSNKASVYCKVYPQRLDGVKLSNTQILYWEKNSAGEIDKLILRDVTGDGFTYGLMATAKQDNENLSGSYQYIISGQVYQLNTTNRLLNIATGSGIKISGNAANPDTMSRLSELSGGVRILNASKLIHKNTNYPISPNVSVYQKSSDIHAEYVKIPISDILNQEDLTISAYYDQTPASGGQIRVIVVY